MINKHFEFGPFKVDPSNSLLLRGQRSIPLPPKAFETLVYLVQNCRRLITREELIKAVWPDSFVEDGNLSVNIFQLRKALGEMEDGQPYIETVPRKGYRFNAEVRVREEDVLSSSPIRVSAGLQPAAAPPFQALAGKEPEEKQTGTEVGRQGVDDNVEAVVLPETARSPESRETEEQTLSPPAIQNILPKLPVSKAGLAAKAKHRWALAGIACVIALAILAIWIAWHPSKRPPAMKQLRLTTFAPELALTAAAVSPDGKFVAYANPSGLFIQDLSTREAHALPDPVPGFQVSTIGWFPDGTQILAGGHEPRAISPSLWEISILGVNAPVKIGNYLRGTVSPDDSEIAFARNDNGLSEIWLMRANGGQPHRLTAVSPGELCGSVFWSDNSQRLLFVLYRWDAQFRETSGEIESYNLKNGKKITVLSGSDLSGDAVSLPGGRIAYTKLLGANPSPLYGMELLEISTKRRTGEVTGPPVLITQWTEPITSLSASTDGNRLVFRDIIEQHSVYTGELGAESLLNVRRLTFGVGRDDFPRAWTPDGKALFFDSNRNGKWEIFRQALNEPSDEPDLQSSDDLFSPRVSPDGQWLLYLDRPRIWREPQPVSVMRVPISGGLPQLVLTASGFSEWGLRFDCPRRAELPCVLAERQGNEIVFRAFDPLKGFEGPQKGIAHVDFDPHTTFNWGISPDGSGLAWVRSEPQEARIHLLSLPDLRGLEPAQAEPDVTLKGWSHLHAVSWSSDGKGWFITTQLPDSWTLLYAGPQGQTRVLWQAASAFAPRILPSPGGRDLAFSEQNSSSNAWLLENF